MITHCNRNDHNLPEDAKRKNLISNKESQRKSLSNSFSISKFRPILPKNELSSPLACANPGLIVGPFGHNTLPLADRSNAHTAIGRLSNGHNLSCAPVETGSLSREERLSELVKAASVMAAGSTLSNLNLQSDCFVDNSCQTDLLCQCPA